MISDIELIVDALKARAINRQKAGSALSAELAVRRADGTDIRSGAVKVVDVMAEADRLNAIAEAVASGVLTLAPAGLRSVAAAPEQAPSSDPDADPDPEQPIPDPAPESDPEDGATVVTVSGLGEFDLLDVDGPTTDDDLAEADALVQQEEAGNGD